MSELSVRGENQKALSVDVETAHAVKVAAQEFVLQGFVEQVKDRLMLSVLVCAYYILAFVHHNVDIVLETDFFVIHTNNIIFNIELKS